MPEWMGARIRDYMTPSPHSIGAEQPLSRAHALMRQHAIRHLPVLHGGKLVGLVSLRDLHLMETLQDVDPNEVTVEEAMSQEVYAVPPTANLRQVARDLARRRLGSAVVMLGDQVVGMFTTVDALRALSDVLSAARPRERRRAAAKPTGARRKRRA